MGSDDSTGKYKFTEAKVSNRTREGRTVLSFEALKS